MLDRLIATTDAIAETTTYAYDPEGNLLSNTDPVGNTTAYTYDELDRRVTDTNELGLTRSYSFDPVDNLVGYTDRNGRQIAYTYDDLNRRTEEQWLAADSSVLRSINYVYDAASQLLLANDPNFTYSYQYDAAGRMIQVDNVGTAGVPNVVFDYGYDSVNNLTAVTDTIDGVAGATETFDYDVLNRVTRITQSGTGVAEKRVDMTYDAASQMTGLSRYGDLAGTQLVAQTSYGYDLEGKIAQIEHGQGAIALAAYAFTYDAGDRITQMTTPDGTNDYTYDDRDQITTANYDYQGDESYSYDSNGNRTNAGYVTGTNNRLLEDGTFSYEYDGEGNLIRQTEIATGEVTTFEWDYRNRLVTVETTDASNAVIKRVEYEYDLLDRRITKIIDLDGDGAALAETERFVYDGDHIALTFDGSGNQTHRYLHGPQIDQILADEQASGDVLWALTDHQGTVRGLLDESGTLVNHLTYDSFGQLISETNPTIDFRFRYTGRELDEATSLYYYRARYYSPANGHFLGEDPITFDGGDANLFRYVFNSPITKKDPTGLVAIADDALIIYGLTLLLGGSLLEYNRRKAQEQSETSSNVFESRRRNRDSDDNNSSDSSPKHQHGGGKNAQHGKAGPKPSDLKTLENLQEKLRNATTRREKIRLRNKIDRLKKQIERDISGENHSQRDKGPNQKGLGKLPTPNDC